MVVGGDGCGFGYGCGGGVVVVAWLAVFPASILSREIF